jgi:glycosyltransferase involved in cell wall biosynthesis
MNGLPNVSRFAAKRLLVVTHVVHYQYGGRVFAHAPYAREIELWVRLFPRILIAAPFRIGEPPRDSLPIEAEDLRLAPLIDVRASTIVAKAVQILLLPVTLWRLCAAMSRVDAVHVRCPGNIGLLGALLAPLVSRYRVAKYAGQWEHYAGEPWTVRAQRAVLRSRWWGAPVLVYGSAAGQRSHVVPFFTSILDATQMERARQAVTGRTFCGSGKLAVLYVGRLSPSKNVDVLIRSVAALEETGRPVTCTVVGDGSERRALERLAYDLGLVDLVRFVGAVPLDRVLDFYESADVVVLPSSTEGWGKAIVEAMAFGVICVGPDCGVVPQLLAEGRGFTVPPKSDDALTEALARVFDEPEKHADMIARGAEWAQQYTLERFGDALSHVLTQHWNVPDEKPQVLPSYA